MVFCSPCHSSHYVIFILISNVSNNNHINSFKLMDLNYFITGIEQEFFFFTFVLVFLFKYFYVYFLLKEKEIFYTIQSKFSCILHYPVKYMILNCGLSHLLISKYFKWWNDCYQTGPLGEGVDFVCVRK